MEDVEAGSEVDAGGAVVIEVAETVGFCELDEVLEINVDAGKLDWGVIPAVDDVESLCRVTTNGIDEESSVVMVVVLLRRSYDEYEAVIGRNERVEVPSHTSTDDQVQLCSADVVGSSLTVREFMALPSSCPPRAPCLTQRKKEQPTVEN